MHLDEDLLKRLLLMVTGNIMIAVVDAVRMVQSSSAVLDEYLNYDMRQYVGMFSKSVLISSRIIISIISLFL